MGPINPLVPEVPTTFWLVGEGEGVGLGVRLGGRVCVDVDMLVVTELDNVTPLVLDDDNRTAGSCIGVTKLSLTEVEDEENNEDEDEMDEGMVICEGAEAGAEDGEGAESGGGSPEG